VKSADQVAFEAGNSPSIIFNEMGDKRLEDGRQKIRSTLARRVNGAAILILRSKRTSGLEFCRKKDSGKKPSDMTGAPAP
jgi:hypothetical protein